MSGKVQTILFPKDEWTITEAKVWLDEHHYKNNSLDITEEHYRFRQMTPMKGGRYITKTLPNGVEIVIHYYK